MMRQNIRCLCAVFLSSRVWNHTTCNEDKAFPNRRKHFKYLFRLWRGTYCFALICIFFEFHLHWMIHKSELELHWFHALWDSSRAADNLLKVVRSCQFLSAPHHLCLSFVNNYLADISQISEFGSKYLKSSPFFVEEAMPLEQGGGEGKPDVESWMPLEHAATVTHPPVIHSKTKIKCLKGKNRRIRS